MQITHQQQQQQQQARSPLAMSQLSRQADVYRAQVCFECSVMTHMQQLNKGRMISTAVSF